MAYILTKQSTLNGVRRSLYYLVESYREGGKVKRRKILGLGESKNIDELTEKLVTKEIEIKGEIQKWEEKMKVNRFWKFQRLAEKWIAEEVERLKTLKEFQRKVSDVKHTYKFENDAVAS